MERDHRDLELLPEQAHKTTDPASLGFGTSDELAAPTTIMGQLRALESIEFALQIPDENYNLYVSGEPGSGRLTSARKAVRRAAERGTPPADWCYVYQFERPGEPLAISLPSGQGHTFARDMDALVVGCRRELRRAFGGEAYRKQRAELLQDITTQREQLLDGLQREALARGFMLEVTPMGLAIIPLKRVERHEQSPAKVLVHGRTPPATDVKPLSPAEFETLSPEERQRVSAEHDRVQETIEVTVPQIRALEEEARDRVRKLDHDVAHNAVDHLASELIARYTGNTRVSEYVRHMANDIVTHADVLSAPPDDETRAEHGHADEADGANARMQEDGASPDDGSVVGDLPLDEGLRERPAVALLLRRYRVNVLVTQSASEKAPVVEEINPTYFNLIGHTEFGLREGLPYTDHLMVKAGALHRANGGYLILQARDLFSHPHAWEAIKRVLRFGVIGIEGSEELGATPASASLRPEPIPAQMKVVLIGSPEIYTALMTLDPEFSEMFKVRADFDNEMPRTEETEHFYAQFVGDVARCNGTAPLSADAVAMLIEESSRWAEDQGRLSTLLRGIQDLTIEASNLARQEGAATTTRSQVAHAIEARERRMSMVPDKLDTMIQQGTILIATSGEVVGQINGLTVMSVAGFAFGKPARITARTSPGLAGIVNLERETLMSGPAHSKGILTLSGYLSGRFAQDYPLSLSGSICFEQIYGEIEGDSASSAELYALLSSLANVPIKQAIAVTGSVNQRGEVQAVGGVNQKVEGFYKVCKARGLTGEQGVIIPRANVRNLMLREEVVDAMRGGQFHVYAVSTIDEGIELLTGMPAGVADVDGAYPEGTINGLVSRTLRTFTERVRVFGAIPLMAGR